MGIYFSQFLEIAFRLVFELGFVLCDSLSSNKTIPIGIGFDFCAVYEDVFAADFLTLFQFRYELIEQILKLIGVFVSEPVDGAFARRFVLLQQPQKTNMCFAGIFYLSA